MFLLHIAFVAYGTTCIVLILQSPASKHGLGQPYNKRVLALNWNPQI